MSHLHRVVLALLLFALAACAGPSGPLFPEVAGTVPPVPADRGRIYFYRDYEPYESLSRPPLYLNGETVGASIPGGVFYRDVAPGTYEIKVLSLGLYPNQFKTVAVRPGDTYYAKIESLRSWSGDDNGDLSSFVSDTFVVVLIDPNQARRELDLMRYVQAEEGPG
jgi:predicted small lipoprotein YifL